MPITIRHACGFLKGNEKIAAFLGVIERNDQLLREVRRALPPPLDEHCLLAVLDAGVLTLTSDSPVWSSRLRFFVPELLRSFARKRGPITSCRVRVQPLAVAPRPNHARRLRLSTETQRHLMDAAAGIEDAELAAALRRLAKTGAANG